MDKILAVPNCCELYMMQAECNLNLSGWVGLPVILRLISVQLELELELQLGLSLAKVLLTKIL